MWSWIAPGLHTWTDRNVLGGPFLPCVKPSCVTRVVKFHLGEACTSSWAPKEPIQAQLRDPADGEFIPDPADCPSIYCLFIRAVKKLPSCFPVYVKLSAYCCKSFELYSYGQALAIFLSPVAFFPSLDPECPELGAAGPGDRECAGPWHRDRCDISDVGSRKTCCAVSLQAAGQGWGVGRRF